MPYQYAAAYQAQNGAIIALTESTSVKADAEREVKWLASNDETNEFFLAQRPLPLWSRVYDDPVA